MRDDLTTAHYHSNRQRTHLSSVGTCPDEPGQLYLLNEFMADSGTNAIRVLSDLAKLLPGRMLVIADYYGRLNEPADAVPAFLLHDFVQLVSGQGIPPPDSAGWGRLYAASGWRLVHVINDDRSNRFVHILKDSHAEHA
ncbi:MAG: hypothetical protein WDN69_12120 [Aliidongia sp.]